MNFAPIAKTKLHVFVDNSDDATRTMLYLRFTNFSLRVQ